MRIFSAFVLALATAVPSAAQTPPPAAPHLQLGPVSLTPKLDVREIGIDDNVFNSPDNPQRDFTSTVIPRVEAAVSGGWLEATGGSSITFVYFDKFASERSFDRSAEGRIEVTQGLLRPYVLGSIVDSHERLNAEIDARARHRQNVYGGGVGLAVTARSLILLQARRNSLEYFPAENFRQIDLSRTMNSTADTYETGLRFALTPLTTWETILGVQHDRFARAPSRDSDSDRLLTSLIFNPSAVIQGRAALGYRRFKPIDTQLAGYNGLIATGALTYTAGGLKLDGAFERDVRYSYQDNEPYYLTKLVRLTVTQVVVGNVDVLGTLARTVMDYRAFSAGDTAVRADRVRTAATGVGYRLGTTARLGVNVEWAHRESDLESFANYDRRRIYGSVTYGF